MSPITVDSLRFAFPAGWRVSKYDEWSYYRNRFCKLRANIKAVDLIAVDNDKTVWLVESKDYRFYQRANPHSLIDDVRDKVILTLSGIVAARFNAVERTEIDMATRVVKAKKIRVVLHLEQRLTTSRLFPRVYKLADVQQKLRSLLKCIDAHPLVVESSNMGRLSWSVTPVKPSVAPSI
jgi:hypothetical protein